MNDRKEELLDRIEEAEFELLLDNYQTELGNACQQAYDKACAEGKVADMPSEIKAQMQKFINEYQLKKKRHPSAALRCCLIAAIIFVTIFALLITVQAAGYDIFSVIGSAAETEFHFSAQTNANDGNVQADKAPDVSPEELAGNDISMELAAIDLPENFTGDIIDMDFSEEESSSLNEVGETEETPQQTNGILQYISENVDCWTNVWEETYKPEKVPTKGEENLNTKEDPALPDETPEVPHCAYEMFYEALRQCEIPLYLAPTWLPEGFTDQGSYIGSSDEIASVATEYRNQADERIVIEIDRFPEDEWNDPSCFEDDEDNAEIYEVKGMQFVLSQTDEDWTGVWQSGTACVHVTTTNRENLIAILDSIPFYGETANLHETLRQNEFPVELAPTWLPEGFREKSILAEENTVSAEYGNSEDEVITMELVHFQPKAAPRYEISEAEPETHQTNGMQFVVCQYPEAWVGLWQSEAYGVYVTAKDKGNLFSVLDSIPYTETPPEEAPTEDTQMESVTEDITNQEDTIS